MTESVVPYKAPPVSAALMEAVLIGGDLSKLTSEQRVSYYKAVCDSIGLNPLTKPFEYLELSGKLVLYARRDCTDQLRDLRKVNVHIVARELVEDVYVVTARATMPDGRTDESIGAVPLQAEGGEWKVAQSGKRYFQGNGEWKLLRGDARANAMMKAETKAKRRVTLSISGLGLMDETEVASIPNARIVQVDAITGEIEQSDVASAKPAATPQPAAAAQPERRTHKDTPMPPANAPRPWTPEVFRIRFGEIVSSAIARHGRAAQAKIGDNQHKRLMMLLTEAEVNEDESRHCILGYLTKGAARSSKALIQAHAIAMIQLLEGEGGVLAQTAPAELKAMIPLGRVESGQSAMPLTNEEREKKLEEIGL